MKNFVITTSTYIGLSLAIFAFLLFFFLMPRDFSGPPGSTRCLVGQPASGENILSLPAVGPDGGPLSTKSDFVLIRQNVPTPEELSFFQTPSYADDDDSHLMPVGELPEKPGYEAFYPVDRGGGEVRIETAASVPLNLFLNQEKIVFFRNKNPQTIKKIQNKADGRTITLSQVDVYQDKTVLNNPAKIYQTEDLFTCTADQQFQTENAQSVVIPQQEKSINNEQLQLEWFVFVQDAYWAIHCKPAVYLYPPHRQIVNVKVNPKGELGYTDPSYDKKTGWTVYSGPDGGLSMLNQTSIPQGYLYYESKLWDAEIKKPKTGWVVKKTELESLFNRVLPELGLNVKEQSDFEGYWLHKLPESPYYFVGLMDKNQRDYLEPLAVTPAPDTSIRFSLFFEPLEQLISVEEPNIVTPQRNGFTLVDWGGMIKLHPGTPFTCSQ